jgi:hypothetical protein
VRSAHSMQTEHGWADLEGIDMEKDI